EFANEHRAGRGQSLDDRGVAVERLLSIGLRAPGGGIALRRQQILHAVRNSVQRSPPFALADFAVGLASFCERALARDRDDCIEARTEPLQTVQAARRQLRRAGLFLSEETTQLNYR